MLAHLGFIEGDPSPPDRAGQEIYELIESILLTEKGWEYSGDFGSESWQVFPSGAEIGRHGDAPLVPDYDGVIVFPKLPKHRSLGKPVGYLAKKIS